MTGVRLNKFDRVVHYICDRCDDTSKLGSTKLNKILWYIDSFSYRLHGETVTGETHYVKRRFGPVPRRILASLERLQRTGRLHVREVEVFGHPKREFVSLKDAGAYRFTEHAHEIMDAVIRVVCADHTAMSISDLSHDIIWESAELGEHIPIYAVLAAVPGALTHENERWADGKIKEHLNQLAA